MTDNGEPFRFPIQGEAETVRYPPPILIHKLQNIEYKQEPPMLSVISTSTTRSLELVEDLTQKINLLMKSVNELNDQTDENHQLILKLFQEINAPVSVKTRAAKPKA